MRKTIGIFCLTLLAGAALAQPGPSGRAEWIRPEARSSKSIWGLRGGIVFALWPYGIEHASQPFGGGPRGLLRIGYEHGDTIYHINYIAIEPVVAGKWEFSEISPSAVDGKWGKLMWAADTDLDPGFHPSAGTRGVISHPDPDDPTVEQLTTYLYMERFQNGAAPYLRVSLRNDRPEELAIEVFHHERSAEMERCAITATMGNYGRLRQLFLADDTVHSAALYAGYDEIDFIEREGYPYHRMLKDRQGDFIVLATTDESMAELADWPTDSLAATKSNWRYRAPFQLTQYWRKERARFDESLHVRVNGRARYWSGASRDKRHYLPIPNGPSFENFELRERYYPGQKFYFGMSRKTVDELLSGR